MVSFSHGRVFAWSEKPPQRSTIVSPSTVAQHEAPTSAPLVRFAAKISRTWLNFSATHPCTLSAGIDSCPSNCSQAIGEMCPRRSCTVTRNPCRAMLHDHISRARLLTLLEYGSKKQSVFDDLDLVF